MIILGIESSCDETGIALYDSEKGLLAEALHSQISMHRVYGGVVPELASRDHLNRALPLLKECLEKASIKKEDIDVVAYTAGPGLLGALLSGAAIAKSLSYALKKPSYKIHHMEGHLLASLMSSNNKKEVPSFPFLSLLVSGGHTLLVAVYDIGNYKVLGSTLDDAVGEAFDKTGKLLGLPYPGGPMLSSLAESGDPNKYDLPRPMLNRPGLDFSFSGLKTKARLLIEENPNDKENIAASFQEALVDTLIKKCERAIKETGFKTLLISGGVSANSRLREKLKKMGTKLDINIFLPELKYCTDNGVMIAHAAYLRMINGILEEDESLEISCFSRWELDKL